MGEFVDQRNLAVGPKEAKSWLRMAAGVGGANTLRAAALLIVQNTVANRDDGVLWEEHDLEDFQLTHRMFIAGCKELHRGGLASLTRHAPGRWSIRLRFPDWPSEITDRCNQTIWGWE